jgi:hypothetical protein
MVQKEEKLYLIYSTEIFLMDHTSDITACGLHPTKIEVTCNKHISRQTIIFYVHTLYISILYSNITHTI